MTTHVEGEPMTGQEPTAAPSSVPVERSEPASGTSGRVEDQRGAEGPSDWVKLIALLESAYTTEGVTIWLDASNRLLAWSRPMYLMRAGRAAEVIAVAERMVGLTWQEVTP